jgi:hypothetical protein
MAHVHLHNDLRLNPVSSEMPLTDEEAHEEPVLEFGGFSRPCGFIRRDDGELLHSEKGST